MSKTIEHIDSGSNELTSMVRATWDYLEGVVRRATPLPTVPKKIVKSPFLLQLRCISLCGTEDEGQAIDELAESLGPVASWSRKHLHLVLDILQECRDWEHPAIVALLDSTCDYLSINLPDTDATLGRFFNHLPEAVASTYKTRLLRRCPKGLAVATHSGGILLQHGLECLDEESEAVKTLHSQWIQESEWPKTRGSIWAILELYLRQADAYPLPPDIEASLDPRDPTSQVLFTLQAEDRIKLNQSRFQASD